MGYATALGSASTTILPSDQQPPTCSPPTSTRQSLGSTFARSCPLAACWGHSQTHQLSPPIHINRFGVIPKGHNTGKWMLITDLSFPPNHSVNDGIDPSLCSLSYISVDQVADIATQYGRGALLAKVDIESAYRLIPVHPQELPFASSSVG